MSGRKRYTERDIQVRDLAAGAVAVGFADVTAARAVHVDARVQDLLSDVFPAHDMEHAAVRRAYLVGRDLGKYAVGAEDPFQAEVRDWGLVALGFGSRGAALVWAYDQGSHPWGFEVKQSADSLWMVTIYNARGADMGLARSVQR